ncbi:MAG: hypothetical protein JY451_07190 [Erythrobacter sp.]|nr:MAG: hypothetical protein JY451_07190 [Erythrobacter sp.]
MRTLILPSLAFAASLAAPAQAQDASWGLAGVSIEDYRTDAVECATQAYYTDLSQTEDAEVFRRATSRLEALEGTAGTGDAAGGAFAGGIDSLTLQRAQQEAQIVESTRADRRFRDLREILQDELEACLIERGYRQFALTAEQREALEDLDRGSDARRTYLHSLASDSAVLDAQPFVSD